MGLLAERAIYCMKNKETAVPVQSMTGTEVFAYMESEKDGILKKIVPGCKIYVKIHLKMSERKVVWQMQRVKQHKWFLFILIGFIVISFFQFLPQTDTLHLYEKTPQSFELTAGGLLKYGIEGQNADQAGECELEEYHTDRLTGPEIAERQACGLPEETPAATLARTTQSEAALGEQNQSRFQMLRFLVEVYVLLMIPAVILHMALKRFSSHMIILWQNIKYIHLVDGKKAKRIPVIE